MSKFALVVALVCLAGSAQGTMIFSDGFNFAGTPPSYITVYSGGTIGPWTVGGASVDWIGVYWVPAEGNGSIDLSGGAAGSLTLSAPLDTAAGQTYRLSFELAGNPLGGNTVKQVRVQVGSVDEVFTFDITGHDTNSMGWVPEAVNFTAAGNDTLTFTSLDQNAWGPALDQVSVSDTVPEPATLMLSGLALLGLGLFRRRR